MNIKELPLNEFLKNKTVAVVGNSLSLFDRKYGNEIDSHDIVIRFNKPAIIYDDNILTHGSRIDIWSFWAIGAFYKKFIIPGCDPDADKLKSFLHDEKIIKTQINANGHITATKKFISYTMPTNLYHILSNELISMSNMKNLTPSSGIAMLDWLSYFPVKDISVYGFDFKETPTFSEIDNFSEDMIGRYDSRCRHDFAAEALYFQKKIQKNKNISLII